MIATICKEFTFDAAHRLDKLPSDHKCHRMHGHTYRARIVLHGLVDSMGFVIDYADLERIWLPLHEALDHRTLNDIHGLSTPTTEHLAAWIIAHLRPQLDGLLDSVIVFESSTTYCAMSVDDLSMEDAARFLPLQP